jgi:hypothetical protein
MYYHISPVVVGGSSFAWIPFDNQEGLKVEMLLIRYDYLNQVLYWGYF